MLNYQRAGLTVPARTGFHAMDVYTLWEERIHYKDETIESVVVVQLRSGEKAFLTDPDRVVFDEIVNHVRCSTDNGTGEAYAAVE